MCGLLRFDVGALRKDRTMDIPTRQLLDMLANVEAREILLERLSLLPEAFAARCTRGRWGRR